MQIKWQLRLAAAHREVWTGAQLRRLLAERSGLHLSSASVSALLTKQPAQVKLATLAALCDILGCEPGDLVEPVAPGGRDRLPGRDLGARPAGPARPRRARIVPGPGKDA